MQENTFLVKNKGNLESKCSRRHFIQVYWFFKFTIRSKQIENWKRKLKMEES